MLYNVFPPVLQFSPVSIIPPLLHTHSFIYHPHCIMFFSQYFSFPCQYHSTIAPYSYIHLPPTLYNVFLPVLQFSPVSTIPPLVYIHSFNYHWRCMFVNGCVIKLQLFSTRAPRLKKEYLWAFVAGTRVNVTFLTFTGYIKKGETGRFDDWITLELISIFQTIPAARGVARGFQAAGYKRHENGHQYDYIRKQFQFLCSINCKLLNPVRVTQWITMFF